MRPVGSVGPVAVALGNFDGVHLGHQAVLRRAVEAGCEAGMPVVAATFDPHPRAVLWPGEQPRLLTTLEMRRELLLRYGADEVRVIRFDKELSRKGPDEFVRDVLVGEVGARVVVVGENFRFGYKAAGNVGDLGRIMRSFGGDAFAVPVREGGTGEISSTRIRSLVSEGGVEEAAKLLGRPYGLRGGVVEGDRRGRTIGFPTANVLPDPSLVVPARGVYAGIARVGEKEEYVACTNVGLAPTFDRRESRVEAHLLDFEGDLYGRVVDLSFVGRIRGEKRFSGVEELKDQIGRDVGEARRMMADAG